MVDLINAINDHFGGVQDLDFYLDLFTLVNMIQEQILQSVIFTILGTLSSVLDDFKNHIDFDSVWREMEMGEFFEIDSHYFLK